MSLLGIGLGLLIPGSGIAAAVFKFGARAVFGRIGSAARAGAAKAATVDWSRVYRTVALLGLPIALFLAVYEWGEARHAGKQLTQEQHRVAGLVRVNAAEVAAHLVTKQSLAGARAEIDASNARVEAAHRQLLEQEQYWQAKDAANRERFKSTAATVAAIEKGATGKRDVPCKVSATALKAVEGL